MRIRITIITSFINNTLVPQTVIYTVTPTASVGSCGSILPQIITVVVNPAPVTTSASAVTICSGSSVNLPLTSGVPSTYTWIATDNINTTGESTSAQTTNTLSNTITNTTAATTTVTGLSQGVYQIVVVGSYTRNLPTRFMKL